MTRDEAKTAPGVPVRATQGVEAKNAGTWLWAEASIWTERMKSALVNGVKGGKWFSLMDKVYVARAPSKPPGRKSGRTKGRRAWMGKVCCV